VDLIIEPILFLWNIIFTFYYTRVRPQCDYSILGRIVRRLEFVHPASFSHLHIWSRLGWLPKGILVSVATTLVLLWEQLESLGHRKSCIIKSCAKPLLCINQQKNKIDLRLIKYQATIKKTLTLPYPRAPLGMVSKGLFLTWMPSHTRFPTLCVDGFKELASNWCALRRDTPFVLGVKA